MGLQTKTTLLHSPCDLPHLLIVSLSTLRLAILIRCNFILLLHFISSFYMRLLNVFFEFLHSEPAGSTQSSQASRYFFFCSTTARWRCLSSSSSAPSHHVYGLAAIQLCSTIIMNHYTCNGRVSVRVRLLCVCVCAVVIMNAAVSAVLCVDTLYTKWKKGKKMMMTITSFTKSFFRYFPHDSRL